MPALAKVHRTQTPADRDSWRAGKGKTAERGYGWRWQKARKTFLAKPENVLCRMCTEEGRVTAATVVDHVIPHKGDQALFWDTSNWQPLCKAHHDSAKQAEERGEAQRRVGLDGLAVARHPAPRN
jgi:5-methylcytosine-specific restriction endonuclease McrA